MSELGHQLPYFVLRDLDHEADLLSHRMLCSDHEVPLSVEENFDIKRPAVGTEVSLALVEFLAALVPQARLEDGDLIIYRNGCAFGVRLPPDLELR